MFSVVLSKFCDGISYLFKDTSHARLIKELSTHTLPILWDDVSNLCAITG